jgi:hypothetical protein
VCLWTIYYGVNALAGGRRGGDSVCVLLRKSGCPRTCSKAVSATRSAHAGIARGDEFPCPIAAAHASTTRIANKASCDDGCLTSERTENYLDLGANTTGPVAADVASHRTRKGCLLGGVDSTLRAAPKRVWRCSSSGGGHRNR